MNQFNKRFQLVPVVQSNTTVVDLMGLVILVAGDLKFKNEKGDTITVTFPAAAAGGAYPHYFWGNIQTVFDTDTTLTDAQMLGIVPASP